MTPLLLGVLLTAASCSSPTTAATRSDGAEPAGLAEPVTPEPDQREQAETAGAIAVAGTPTAATPTLRALDTSPRAGHPIDHADAFFVELVPHVEAACEAAFSRAPRVIEVDAREAAAIFQRDLTADYAARYPNRTEGQRRTLLASAARAVAASSVARYSVSERAVLLVRTSFDDQRRRVGLSEADSWDWLRATLAHELVHALDDQRFDLAPRYAAAASDPEATRALAMVIEGRAVYFGRIAAATAGLDAEIARGLPGGSDPTGVAALTFHLTYGVGAEFVAALVRRGGTELADGALERSPRETHRVCHPDRWPHEQVDPRPDRVLLAAALGAPVTPLSELQLLVRYSLTEGLQGSRALFAEFRGGRQVVANDTNHAVLAFATEAAAERYATLDGQAGSIQRHGTLVLRASGGDSATALDRLVTALDP